MSTNPPDGQTPHDAGGVPDDPAETPPVATPDASYPVIPPEPPTPPTSGRPAPPPPGYVAPGPVNPYLTPPTGAVGGQAPPAPPQSGAPYYYPGAPSPAVQPRQGMGNGAKLGLGTGIGCLSYILAIPALFLVMPLFSSLGGFGWLFIFVIPAIIGAALMVSPRSRRVGLGMLIIAAAAWLVVIGPCIALLGGL